MKKFNEFAEESALDGNKIPIDTILNQEIAVINFTARNSRFSKCNGGNYTILQIEQNNQKFVIFTASEVLTDQLNKYKENMPYLATIVKIGSYYSLK